VSLDYLFYQSKRNNIYATKNMAFQNKQKYPEYMFFSISKNHKKQT